MQKNQISFLLLSLFFWTSISWAFALDVEIEQSTNLVVRYNQETLFEGAALTPESLERLKSWLKNPPKQVTIGASKGFLSGLPVELKVSDEIAKKWKSEPTALAELFAARLNKALGGGTQPAWTSDGQLVPLGESRIAEIKPFRPADGLSATSSDPGVVKVEALGSGRFRLSSVERGQATIVVTTESGLKIPSLPVSVKPWAARWDKGPGTFSFWGPATSGRCSTSLERWLSARTLVGAKIELNELKSENQNQRKYKARASAPNAITVEESFDIAVKEYPKEPFTPAQSVVLSNHPERIVSDGVLFERRADKLPLRFMWHHRNDPAGPERFLVLQVTNPSATSRRFRVLWYSYGPSPDEIHVGHIAALDYSQAAAKGLGEEFVLPPNGSRTIEIRRVKPGQTMSGMAYFQDVSGSSGPLEIKVLATSGDGDLPTESATQSDRGRTASGVFPGDIQIEASHTLGGPFTYLEFGGEPYEKDFDKGHPSYGNFGTVYRTRLMIKNPSEQAKEAQVGFASGGGAARGVLSLDGELYDLPMGVTGNGLPVRSYKLEPGESRQVDIELFPQAGSNYPVRVVIRSDFERREKEEIPPVRSLVPLIP